MSRLSFGERRGTEYGHAIVLSSRIVRRPGSSKSLLRLPRSRSSSRRRKGEDMRLAPILNRRFDGRRAAGGNRVGGTPYPVRNLGRHRPSGHARSPRNRLGRRHLPQGASRAGFLGFAVFGWIYMAAAFSPYGVWPWLPTRGLLEQLAPRIAGINGPFPPAGGMGGMGGGMRSVLWSTAAEHFLQIGHCLFALLAASLGAVLSRWLFAAAIEKSEETTARSPAADEVRPWKRWVTPLVFASSGLALVSIASAGSVLPPGIWAGSTFLLTWCLLGLMAFGASAARGRHRQAWLGAAVFGMGFMIMSFVRFDYGPQRRLPTAEFLDELRPWLPPIANGLWSDSNNTTAANARIHQLLNQPLPMHFNEETPLEDVLNHIKKATSGKDGKGIPIYVDPIGLSEADKTMASTIRNIELDGVPLRVTLRLCLNQLDLAFGVTDGYLLITSKESIDEALLFAREDAFQTVGHCALALMAAGIGGLAAPFVCNVVRRDRRATGHTTPA